MTGAGEGPPGDGPQARTRGAGRHTTGPRWLAHRGDHRAHAENTLAAFRRALKVPGIAGVELDVRESRDGIPVVLHDPTLERVFGTGGAAAGLDAADLTAFGVPTLAAALDAMPEPALIDIELKVDAAAGAIDAVRRARGRASTGVVLSSFEPGILRSVGRLAPGCGWWLNARDLRADTLALAVDLGCSGIAVTLASLDPSGMERARALGLEVVAWTARQPDQIEWLRRLGVDAACVEAGALAAIPGRGDRTGPSGAGSPGRRT